MSWNNSCSECGNQNTHFKCIAENKNKIMKPNKNCGNENIDAIKEYTNELDKVISNRDQLIEISKEALQEDVEIRFGDHEKIFISSLGPHRVVDFLIGLSNERVNELKKNISDALYPTKERHD